MRFLVSRPGVYDGPPWDRAVLRPYVGVHRRTVDDPAKIPAHGGDTEWWYGAGRNHRIEEGMIARDEDHEGWMIDIETVDQLAAIVSGLDQWGVVALTKADTLPPMLRLEIGHECE